MRQISGNLALDVVALTAAIAFVGCEATWGPARANEIFGVNARVVALNIPGASAISEVGTFLNVPPPGACANPIPSKFPTYIQPGAVLDPKRILVGSQFELWRADREWRRARGLVAFDRPERAVHSETSPRILRRAATKPRSLAGAVQMFSANSPHWLNSVNNPGANTARYAGVSNPLGLSNNNAFGRVWPANAPFGETGIGSSSILDPTGLPLAGSSKQSDRRGLRGQPDQPQRRDGAATTAGHSGLAKHWRGGDRVARVPRRMAPARPCSRLSRRMAPSSKRTPSRGSTVWRRRGR